MQQKLNMMKKSSTKPLKPIGGKNISEKPEKQQSTKKFEEYQQTIPFQLALFQLDQPQDLKYSQTIDLYDFIPKFFWGKVKRIEGRFLDRLERDFEVRGTHYKVEIDPAKIKDDDGIVRDYFPGKMEELVEMAIRKLAVEGNAVFLDEEAAVKFTINQLRQELARRGHSYSADEIQKALIILKGTTLKITSGVENYHFNPISDLGIRGTADENQTFVRFSYLVTKSIKEGTYRLINYEKLMGYKSVIARQMHKRLTHFFTQAGISTKYTIMLSSLIRDFGLTAYGKLPQNLRDVESALEELINMQVIIKYECQRIPDVKRKNKIADYKIVISPHLLFSGEVVNANSRNKQRRLEERALDSNNR